MSMQPEPIVRTSKRGDVRAAARVLADAFADDPLMAYIWPDREARIASLPKYFEVSLRHVHSAGGGVQVVCGAGGRIAGVAVWDPPNRWEQSTTSAIRAAPGQLLALRTRVFAALRVRGTLEERHPRHPPHWYLSNIGTASAVRGAGYGRALLDSRLADCDANELSAYLVCTRRENIAYYEKFGFVVTESFSLPGNGPELWSMVRVAAVRTVP